MSAAKSADYIAAEKKYGAPLVNNFTFYAAYHTNTVNKIIQSADMKEFFLKEGAEPAPMKSAEFESFIGAEIERWKKVAKAADIKPE